MKAYVVTSWGDSEYFFSEEEANARRDEIEVMECQSEHLAHHDTDREPIRPKVFEIEIK